LSGVQ
jgi:hypothetical protein